MEKQTTRMQVRNWLAAILLSATALNAQTSYTFTPAGATGRFGPTQTQVTNSYSLTNLNGLVATTTATSGIQTFTIPAGVTSATIEAYGAQGGSVSGTPNLGGLGARMKGTFTVVPGSVLHIVVGQAGLEQDDGNCNGGGGAGGSFVYFPAASQPLIVAGGGGGAHAYMGPGTDGTVSTSASTSPSVSGTPGTGGNGGGAGTCGSGWPGAAGGGWLTAGGNGCLWSGQPTEGGYTQFSWLGGARNPNTSPGTQGQDGSFGGGGAAFHGAGGGGGYSGGGGGGSCFTGEFPLGGGGGSYNSGLNQSNSSGVQSGDGMVIITIISCTPGATPTNTTPAANQNICVNNSSTLMVTGTGTLNWYATPTSTTSLGTGSVYTTPTLAVGVYTYYAASTNTCSEGARTPITLTVSSTFPTVAITGGTVAACAGLPVNLTASGAATYSWNTGATTASIAPTPTANTTYTATGTNSLGCSANAVVSVSVIPAPSMTVTGSTTLCTGQSTTLNASGANSYSWSTGAATPSISAAPSTSTVYTIVGTSSVSGCSQTLSINVTVSACTGISSNAAEKGLLLYPNPNNGEFTVELNNGLTKNITVKDINGKIVFNVSTSKDKANVNITNLSNGIYFITIQSDNFNEVIKMIKE